MLDALVSHDTRLRHLSMDERDRLRSIAMRARRVQDGGARPEYGRLYADVVTLLHIIGGEDVAGLERLPF